MLVNQAASTAQLQAAGGGGGVEGWQDVGGLADVRAALQEALELPTKYAALIARSTSCHVPSCTCSIASLGFLATHALVLPRAYLHACWSP